MKLANYIFLILIVMLTVTLGFSKIDLKKEEATSSRVSQNQSSTEQAFDKMMTVLMHKRCVNCHPAGDRPRQGEDSHIHDFNVQRGSSNFGEGALSCNTCHHEENNNYAGVPGAPEWSLAPIEMAWEGKTKQEIARSILDKKINGGRDLAQTVEHLTEHELVLWAWEPGVDANGVPREKPPVSKKEYIKAVKEWAAGGAVIPE